MVNAKFLHLTYFTFAFLFSSINFEVVQCIHVGSLKEFPDYTKVENENNQNQKLGEVHGEGREANSQEAQQPECPLSDQELDDLEAEVRALEDYLFPGCRTSEVSPHVKRRQVVDDESADTNEHHELINGVDIDFLGEDIGDFSGDIGKDIDYLHLASPSRAVARANLILRSESKQIGVREEKLVSEDDYAITFDSDFSQSSEQMTAAAINDRDMLVKKLAKRLVDVRAILKERSLAAMVEEKRLKSYQNSWLSLKFHPKSILFFLQNSALGRTAHRSARE